MDPINYSGAFSNVPSPMQSFTQGLQTGAGVQQLQLQQQMQRMQMARMQQMQQASYQVAQNPTPQSIAQLSIAFPEMSENFKRSYDMWTPAQQQARVNQLSQVYAAAQNGRPDISADLLRQQAQAARNSGDDQGAKNAETMAQWAETHPDTFKLTTGSMLAAAMGPDKFGQTFKDIGSEQRDQNLFPAKQQQAQAEASTATTTALNAPAKQATDISNVQSQINQRAGQLALDRDKLTSETQLKLRELGLQYGTPPDDTRKLINDSAMSAAAGEQSAARLNGLADRMDQMLKDRTGLLGSGYGLSAGGSAYDLFAKVSGGDASTALKQEYARIVNSQALSSMKDALGGRVTDVDMKAAMGAVPGPNASPEVVTSYLRGAAKLQQLDAARQQAQAEWLSQVGRAGHLGPTKQDITVMGTQVPAGTSFADWSRQFVQKRAEQLSAQSQMSRVANYPFMQKWGGTASQPAQAAPSAQGAQPGGGMVGAD